MNMDRGFALVKWTLRLIVWFVALWMVFMVVRAVVIGVMFHRAWSGFSVAG